MTADVRGRWAERLAPALEGVLRPCGRRCGRMVRKPRRVCDECKARRQRRYMKRYRDEHPDLRAREVRRVDEWRREHPDKFAAQRDRKWRKLGAKFDEQGRRICEEDGCDTLLVRSSPRSHWPRRCPEHRVARKRALDRERKRRA